MKPPIDFRPFWFLALTLVSGCSSNDAPRPKETWKSSPEQGWSSKDLVAGPTEILKSPLALVACPFRLAGQEIDGISASHEGSASAVGTAVLIPFRAIIDGAFSGIGYLGGGVIDTVSGGTAGLVSGATGDEEPNGSIHCVLSGS